MIAGDVALFGPLVFVVILDVLTGYSIMNEVWIGRRPTPLLRVLVGVPLARFTCGQLFEDKESSQSKSLRKAPLEDSRINTGPFQLRPVHLEVPMAVLGQPVLIGWTSARQINLIELGYVRLQSSWGAIDLFAVVGSPGAVDVEASENLRDGLIDAKNNLCRLMQGLV